MATADDLGMLKEASEESAEDVLRRQLLEKDREMDKLLARNLALEDELSQRPPLEEFKRLQGEKKEVDWLFASSNRLNEKCMAKEQRDARWIGILERKLTEIVGDDWQSTLNISSTSAAGGDVSSTTTSFQPQAESTMIARTSTPDSFMFAHAPTASSHSPVFTSTSTITPNSHRGHLPPAGRSMTSSPSPSFASGSPATPSGPPTMTRARHTPMNSTTSLHSTLQRDIATTTLAHIAEVRALVLGMEEKMDARESALRDDIARAAQESVRLAGMRREVEGVP